jgi:hypothetical protein
MTNKDLRNTKFSAERKAVCKQFGVSEEDIFLKNNSLNSISKRSTILS